MSITAEQLSKKGAHGKVFDTIVRDQLSTIDGALAQANKTWGRNVVEYDLPSVFPFTGLGRKTAQYIVYSQLIRHLTNRGFEVRVAADETRAVLCIAWVTDLDPKKVKAMRTIIDRVGIPLDEIAAFRRGS